jgi:hypothetical protein
VLEVLLLIVSDVTVGYLITELIFHSLKTHSLLTLVMMLALMFLYYLLPSFLLRELQYLGRVE